MRRQFLGYVYGARGKGQPIEKGTHSQGRDRSGWNEVRTLVEVRPVVHHGDVVAHQGCIQGEAGFVQFLTHGDGRHFHAFRIPRVVQIICSKGKGNQENPARH